MGDPEDGGRGRGSGPPWKNVFLEILVRTSLEKQLDPLGPIASEGGPNGPP